MDELLFRLSNQLEALQVQASVTAQQGQQWCAVWFAEVQRLSQDLYNEQYGHQVIDFVKNLGSYLESGWEQLQFHYYSLQFNPREFYQHLGNLCFSDVTRRELAFCITGLIIGSVAGYNIGLNWQRPSHHMHHMKAIICHHYIGIEGVSTIDDAEMPTIQKSNELLIQVRAASVNVVDAKICWGYSKAYRRLLNSGRYKELPVTLGRDCSGVVVDIGQSVINFDIGDEVYLAVPPWASGTMAEYLVIPECQVAKRPRLVTFEASASLPYSGCLAWDALVNKSNIQEGNARGKRVLVYGGSTPVGCILIQLVKFWGGHVVTACKPHAIPVTRALGADEVIPFNESNIEKELELHDKYHAIFYTGGQPIDEFILKKHLLPYGSYVSTMPEYLTSDSLGFFFGSIFSGCVRIKLMVQYMFGCNIHHWKEGSKINTAYLQSLRDLVDADQLQTVVDRAFAPHNIEQALHHVLDPNAIGSTIIKFQ
ncbi:reticulon-4-interacting protein 1 homolog, mitochondrial isoform X2 [Cephus cinctus]|uniref:Reticulon-4-interacting protein 1 homolog, mitochondrial isoform X2 n=1 Tax=Cephus cinctus TaxID=211228 RepID=A0AAJ7BJ23_CEPCN|nr:reticulon-4-interacting protein 1 homolog, mitochondrial isoform X2 [Cephus cinctus]